MIEIVTRASCARAEPAHSKTAKTPAKAQRRKDFFDELLRFSLRLCAFAGDFKRGFVYNPETPESSMLTKAIQNHGATLKRGLGLLLVLFILYGTTVEAAHRHGVAASQSNSAASVTNPNSGANGTFSKKPGCSDCLICQLHQNFSATLISVKLNTAPLARVTHALTLDPVSTRSIAHRSQSGRAPPQAN